VETFLDSHSREKCVYKRKCVSTLIKGKHDTWLARGLTTYKYEKARSDKNLHRQLQKNKTGNQQNVESGNQIPVLNGGLIQVDLHCVLHNSYNVQHFNEITIMYPILFGG
jgi:hypothetical protein